MGTKVINNLKGYEKVKELVNGELEDYSYFDIGNLEWNDNYGDYDKEDEEEHYSVEIIAGEKKKTLSFNYNTKEDKIEIEIGEDSWHETCDYQYTIKYFWMALLEW